MRGIMSAQNAHDVQDLINFSMGLRLKKQERYRKQLFGLPVTKEEHADQVASLQEELAYLEKVHAFMQATSSPQNDLDEMYEKILKLRSELQDLEKAVPTEEDSILSESDIALLNGKYLPLAQWLWYSARRRHGCR